MKIGGTAWCDIKKTTCSQPQVSKGRWWHYRQQSCNCCGINIGLPTAAAPSEVPELMMFQNLNVLIRKQRAGDKQRTSPATALIWWCRKSQTRSVPICRAWKIGKQPGKPMLWWEDTSCAPCFANGTRYPETCCPVCDGEGTQDPPAITSTRQNRLQLLGWFFTAFLKRLILSEANGLLKLFTEVFQCWLLTLKLISLYVSSVLIHPVPAQPFPYQWGQMKNQLWSRSSASPLSCSLSTSKSLQISLLS